MTLFRSLPPAVLATILPLAVAAQDATPDPVPADMKDQDETFLREVDNIDVVTADGERIGEIEEVLIDMDGYPASFVVEVGGFLGIGDYEVMLPIDALTYTNGEYVSKMTQTQLENLPRWEDRAD